MFVSFLADPPYKNDISSTVSKVPQLLSAVDAVVHNHYPDWEVCWYGHIGDGNLHLNMLKPENLDLDEELDISDEDSNDDGVMKNDEHIQQHSYLCPIKSCTFVMSFYDETTKNKHFETQHDGEINWSGVSFIKL